MTRKLLCLGMLILMVVSLEAQDKKRAFKPISFRVLNIEPTTVITNEPFRVTYRLEYLLPRDGKEVKILDNLDKDHFQSALGVPLDIDLEAIKKKLKMMGTSLEKSKLKIDSGPRITVYDFSAGEEEVLGEKLRRDYLVTLKVMREKVTQEPIHIIRLELPEVPVSWAVARFGQKEGEYDHEDPIKSQKVRVNHALSIPTHDPNLNFRSAVVIPQYSPSSISWFSWGFPALGGLMVLLLGWHMMRVLKQPIYVAEDKSVDDAVQIDKDDTSGVKRLKPRYARNKLWKSVTAIVCGANIADPDIRKKLITDLYEDLYNFLLASVPSAPVGSLPANFIKILKENKRGSVLNDTLIVLAMLAEALRRIYESLGAEEITDSEFNEVVIAATSVRHTAKRLWSLYRLIPGLKRFFSRPKS